MSNNTGILSVDGTLYLNGKEITASGSSVNNTFSKICVYGTSIEVTPATGSAWSKYMADALGLTYGWRDDTKQVVNWGKGGGGVTWYAEDVQVTETITAYHGHCLGAFSCSDAEKQAAADYFLAQGLFTEEEITTAKSDGTWNMIYTNILLSPQDVDLYIFGTYGINDRMQWMTWEDDNGNTQTSFTVHADLAFDRRTIYGAYNYVLRALYRQNPNAKVVILGQHTRQWNYQDAVNGIQRAVAEKWQIPFADWGNYLSLNDTFKKATPAYVNASNPSVTRTIYNSDSVHLLNEGAQLLGKWVADYITTTELTPLNPRWGTE